MVRSADRIAGARSRRIAALPSIGHRVGSRRDSASARLSQLQPGASQNCLAAVADDHCAGVHSMRSADPHRRSGVRPDVNACEGVTRLERQTPRRASVNLWNPRGPPELRHVIAPSRSEVGRNARPALERCVYHRNVARKFSTCAIEGGAREQDRRSRNEHGLLESTAANQHEPWQGAAWSRGATGTKSRQHQEACQRRPKSFHVARPGWKNRVTMATHMPADL